MKVALAVNRVTADPNQNLDEILNVIDTAAEAAVDLILFPEAAITGLINNDDPAHDLPLGQEIPGPLTERLALRCQEGNLWMGIGLLERCKHVLYDTAILIAPEGDIKLKYRRIQPQWHGKHADPRIYRQGNEVTKVETPLGSFAFLICGDLFVDEIADRVCKLQPDWLLFPFARCFDDYAYDQARWDQEEQATYLKRVALIGAPTLMTNYVAGPEILGGAFGGAWVVNREGTVQAALPLGQPGLLITTV